MSYANRTLEGAMVTGYGKALLGGCYGRDPLTHEELEALDLKSVTEEITAEQARDLPLREPQRRQRLRRKMNGNDGLADRPLLSETCLTR